MCATTSTASASIWQTGERLRARNVYGRRSSWHRIYGQVVPEYGQPPLDLVGLWYPAPDDLKGPDVALRAGSQFRPKDPSSPEK